MTPRPRLPTESCHLRLDRALIARLRALALAHNRNFNNLCETMLQEAAEAWERDLAVAAAAQSGSAEASDE